MLHLITTGSSGRHIWKKWTKPKLLNLRSSTFRVFMGRVSKISTKLQFILYWNFNLNLVIVFRTFYVIERSQHTSSLTLWPSLKTKSAQNFFSWVHSANSFSKSIPTQKLGSQFNTKTLMSSASISSKTVFGFTTRDCAKTKFSQRGMCSIGTTCTTKWTERRTRRTSRSSSKLSRVWHSASATMTLSSTPSLKWRPTICSPFTGTLSTQSDMSRNLFQCQRSCWFSWRRRTKGTTPSPTTSVTWSSTKRKSTITKSQRTKTSNLMKHKQKCLKNWKLQMLINNKFQIEKVYLSLILWTLWQVLRNHWYWMKRILFITLKNFSINTLSNKKKCYVLHDSLVASLVIYLKYFDIFYNS